jgi:hypothetical protein
MSGSKSYFLILERIQKWLTCTPVGEVEIVCHSFDQTILESKTITNNVQLSELKGQSCYFFGKKYQFHIDL